MTQNGSDLSKVKLQQYKNNYRGVIATQDIKAGESVIFVPRKLIITSENIPNKYNHIMKDPEKRK